MTTYRIVRNYEDESKAPRLRTIQRGLTLEQAKAYCESPEASSRTAKGRSAMYRTKLRGPWHDTYVEE